MRDEDMAAVSAISDAVHGAYSERPEIYAERLTLHPAGCRLFEKAGKAVGYILSHPWPHHIPPKLNAWLGQIPDRADNYYLHDIALLPEARGTGAGAQATAFILAHAKTLGAHYVTLVAVNGADSFWSAQGFMHVTDGQAAITAAYGPGCYLMRYPLGA